MTNHAQRQLANTLRSMLVDCYGRHGDAFGLGLARRCAFEIGNVVEDIHGKAKAVEVIKATAHALIENRPLVDVPDPVPTPPAVVVPAPTLPAVPEGMMLVTIPTTVEACDVLGDILEDYRNRLSDAGAGL